MQSIFSLNLSFSPLTRPGLVLRPGDRVTAVRNSSARWSPSNSCLKMTNQVQAGVTGRIGKDWVELYTEKVSYLGGGGREGELKLCTLPFYRHVFAPLMLNKLQGHFFP